MELKFKTNIELAGDMNAYASERGWQIVGGRLQFRGADAENEEQGVSNICSKHTNIDATVVGTHFDIEFDSKYP